MNIRGIYHFTMIVPNIAEATKFYHEVLGFVVAKTFTIENTEENKMLFNLENASGEGVFLKSGWGFMRLITFSANVEKEQFYWEPVNSLGYRHFSLITGDAMRFYERTRKDVLWHSEPVGHTVEEDNEAWASYGRDPFGNVIEIWSLGKQDPQPFAPEDEASLPVNDTQGLLADVSQDVFGMHHAAIVVPNLGNAIAFYEKAFGLENVQYGPIENSSYAEKITMLKGVNAIGYELKAKWGFLEVWEFLAPVDNTTVVANEPYSELGITSISFMVEDIDAEILRLSEDIDFFSRPVKFGDSKVVIGRDPTGNLIELWQLGDIEPQPHAPQHYPYGK